MSRILLALTSHAALGDTGRTTGFFLSEAAHPYYVFAERGHDVSFVSIAGGEPPQDGPRDDAVVQRFLADEAVRTKLAKATTPATLDPAEYDLIFFVGGHGAMWDFTGPGPLQDLAASIYELGGVVAGVCHGPAALVNLRLSSGDLLVAGKRIAAFTDDEERTVGLTDVVPFLLQSTLEERGAILQVAPNFQENAVADGRVVTGQNPASATRVAELALDALAAEQSAKD